MKHKKLLFLFLGLVFPMLGWAQLSGNYTINPAGSPTPPNFISFTAAVSALTTQGVSGHTTFTVSPGTYTETFTITSIPGAGSNATVTFQSSSGPENCIVSFNTAAGGIAIGTVNLRGARYVSFKGITMRNIQAANSAALHIFAGDGSGTYDVRAEYLNFDNCHFVVDTTNTAANRFGVLIANNNAWAGYSGRTTLAHKVMFKKCLFKGGSDGLGVLPSGTANWYSFPVDSISVDSSEAVQQRSYGLEFWGCKNISVTNSRIHQMRTGDGNASAVRINHSLEFNVRGNYIICGHRIGMWLDVGGNPATFGPSYVVNNYIVTGGATNQAAYLTGSKNVRYYHNTFLASGAGGVGVDFNGAIAGNEFVNNIITAGTNTNVNVFNSPNTAGGFTALDYNVYYGANGGDVRFYWGTNYTGLNAWKTAVPAFNVNAVFGVTTFAANSPEITDPATARTGTNLGITTDIFGQTRAAAPTIGAYEYIPPAPMVGIYTINPSGSGTRNFTSFGAVVDALHTLGISGHVIFEVSPAIYAERFALGNVTGSGPNARITFEHAGSPASCVVEYNSSLPSPAPIAIGTVNLQGARYVSFKGITMRNIQAANSAALHIFAGDGSGTYDVRAEYLNFDNCHFVVDTTNTTGNRYGVFISNNNSWNGYSGRTVLAHKVTFRKCLFKGGSDGIGVLPSGTANWYSFPVDSISVDSSEAVLQRSYGLEFWGCKNVSVTNSRIHQMRTGDGSASALRFFHSLEFDVRNNYIICGHRIGLWLDIGGNPATFAPSYVVNNYIVSSGATNQAAYLTGSKNVRYYHNTFLSSGTGGVGVDFNGAITGNEFVNNIITAGTNTNVNVFNSPNTAGGFTALDYNVYYGANGGDVRFYWGTNYTGLNAWKTAVPAFNINAVFGVTTFAANSPEITDPATARAGTNLGITTDIFGQTRAAAPTIGAYEYPLPPAPGQPGPFIVKTDTICNPPQSGVRYTINSVPGATAYEWESNGGWWNIAGAGAGVTFTGGPDDTSVLIEFMASANTGFLTVRPKNAGGTGPGQTIQVVVLITPQPPGAFTTSSATVCQGQSGVTYTVPNVAGVTYNWSYSGTGATINGSGNSVTVDFSASATNGNLQVTASNTCGASTARSIAVTVNPLPTQPDAFTASSANVCAGQTGVVYTVPNVANTTYNWSYTGTGATINGSGNSVTVDFSAGATNGVLGVTATNSCGTSPARTQSVTVNPLPVVTVTPSAPADICAGDTVTLTAGSGTGYSYEWKDGAGTVVGNAIAYDALTTGDYRVVVTTTANCTDSSNLISVTVLPVPQISLTPGDTAFCEGGIITLHAVTTDTGLNYRWKNGNNTIPQATADFLEINASGAYSVVAGRTHIAGCMDSSTAVTVTVHPLPVVSVNWDGLLLHATPGYTGYQWHTGGQSIAGATDSTYEPSANGSFTVTVTDSNNCSALSAVIQADNVSVTSFSVSGNHVQVYPNPAGHTVYINAPVDVDVMILSMDGKMLQHTLSAQKLDISHLPDGVYLLRITHDGICLKHERLTKTGR